MKKPYQELSDLQKLQKQWHKLSGLHTREEWSAAIIRSSTAAEIAANFAIRSEFADKSQFDSQFIDSLLLWAKGLAGKLDRLLLPLTATDKSKKKKMKALKDAAKTINLKRNAIVHQGEFCNEEEAKDIINQAKIFITDLIQLYQPSFEL